MKEYAVPVHLEELVHLYVSADNAEKAKELAFELFDEYGGSFIPDKHQKHRHRDWTVMEPRKVSE